MSQLTPANFELQLILANFDSEDLAQNDSEDLAQNLFEQEVIDGTEVAFRAEIAADPGCADGHLRLGHLLEKERKDIDGAKAAYSAAILAEPGSKVAQRLLEKVLKGRAQPIKRNRGNFAMSLCDCIDEMEIKRCLAFLGLRSLFAASVASKNLKRLSRHNLLWRIPAGSSAMQLSQMDITSGVSRILSIRDMNHGLGRDKWRRDPPFFWNETMFPLGRYPCHLHDIASEYGISQPDEAEGEESWYRFYVATTKERVRKRANDDGGRALLDAVEWGDVEETRMLIQWAMVDVDVRWQGDTAIAAAAKKASLLIPHSITARYTAIVRILIDAGADVNAEGRYGCTAMTFANAHRNAPIVEMLREAGATPPLIRDPALKIRWLSEAQYSFYEPEYRSIFHGGEVKPEIPPWEGNGEYEAGDEGVV